MDGNKKRIGILFTSVSLLLGAAGAPAHAIKMYDPAYVAPTYSFTPLLEDVTVEKDGSLTGKAIIEPDFDASVSLFLVSEEGEEVEIQVYGGLIIGQDRSDIKTKVKSGTQKIKNFDGVSINIDVKTITFEIPAKYLELEPGDYTIVLKTRNTLAFTSDVTREAYSKEQQLTIPENETAFTTFPGKLTVNKQGTIQITLKLTPDYDRATFYFVVLDEREQEVKRIAFNPKSPQITAKGLDLPAGEYTVYIEIVDGRQSVRSDTATLVISGSSASAGTVSLPGGSYFPGEVIISRDGTIQISLQVTAEYAKAKFYLLIRDSRDKVVKRIPISLSNPKVSSKGLSLSSGEYSIVLEMVHAGKSSYSTPVSWSIPSSQPTTTGTGGAFFPIPSGESFPGGIKVNANGTITITLEWNSSYESYDTYFVVFDIYGNEIKRVSLNGKNPNVSLKDLKLGSGGYLVVIEIVDSSTGLSARSLPTFVTVNQTKGIQIFIDGELQTYQKAPVEINGRTLVPLRAIFEALGAKVEWDDPTQTVTATKDNNVIKLTIGSKVAYKNGQPILLDVPAQLFNGDTTMVPIRFVSEALGAKVGWDAYSNSVVISNP